MFERPLGGCENHIGSIYYTNSGISMWFNELIFDSETEK